MEIGEVASYCANVLEQDANIIIIHVFSAVDNTAPLRPA